MESVILKRFDNYFSAHILQTRLAEHDIDAYIIDENTVTLSPFYSNAIGNIKLIVADYDAAAAETLLKNFEEEERRAYTQCPQCINGTLVLLPANKVQNKLAAIFTWLFSNLAISTEQVWQCDTCGFETKQLNQQNEIT
jgi:uncharacterized protein with PIN domain